MLICCNEANQFQLCCAHVFKLNNNNERVQPTCQQFVKAVACNITDGIMQMTAVIVLLSNKIFTIAEAISIGSKLVMYHIMILLSWPMIKLWSCLSNHSNQVSIEYSVPTTWPLEMSHDQVTVSIGYKGSYMFLHEVKQELSQQQSNLPVYKLSLQTLLTAYKICFSPVGALQITAEPHIAQVLK